jgi:predicted dithiol-disulfide oxidoreductase (DUF899 family)
MQDHRVIALDEWFPARRRRLSRENEVSRCDQWCAERRRKESGADFDLPDRMRHDRNEEEPRVLISAA